MEALSLIFTVTLIHLLAVISPGPDFLMAVRNSLTYSRKTGIWTSMGFGLGIAVHITYCIAGLAVLISTSIIAFTVVKLLGAGYLIYIGIRSIFSRGSKLEINADTKKVDISKIRAVKIGFLTNVLNPKATLFFLSLFTFVITPGTSYVVLLILSVIMIVNTVLWFSLVSVFFTQRRIQNAFDRFQNPFNKIFGGLLVFIGIKLSLTEK